MRYKRKIYIDVGGHKGTVLNDAIKKRKDFEFYTFEPNPVLWKFLEDLPVKIIKAAAWTHDGEVDFFPAKQSAGATLIKGKRTGKIQYGESTKVKCYDFGKWLKDNFDFSDYVVVNFNIEGAEYQILEKMIEDKTILYINHLTVSFHADKFKDHKELL